MGGSQPRLREMEGIGQSCVLESSKEGSEQLGKCCRDSKEGKPERDPVFVIRTSLVRKRGKQMIILFLVLLEATLPSVEQEAGAKEPAESLQIPILF